MGIERSCAALHRRRALYQKITASIVLYNHSARDVASLFGELAKDASVSEWAVVNNGGSDEACALAESLGGRCLHPGRNLGFGAGHNLALRSLAPEPYHLILNPDIMLGNGTLTCSTGSPRGTGRAVWGRGEVRSVR